MPGKDVFIIESRLSADMNRISSWMNENELILNLKKGKTESMLFGTSKKLAAQSDILRVTFSYENVHYTTSYKYLGVEVDSTLNLNTYFDSTYKKGSSRLKVLHKIRQFIDSNCAGVIYQSMILPLFTYAGTLQLKYCNTQKNKLASFHKRAMQLVNTNKLILSPDVTNKIHSLLL